VRHDYKRLEWLEERSGIESNTEIGTSDDSRPISGTAE
jgi:hypothetical protein